MGLVGSFEVFNILLVGGDFFLVVADFGLWEFRRYLLCFQGGLQFFQAFLGIVLIVVGQVYLNLIYNGF